MCIRDSRVDGHPDLDQAVSVGDGVARHLAIDAKETLHHRSASSLVRTGLSAQSASGYRQSPNAFRGLRCPAREENDFAIVGRVRHGGSMFRLGVVGDWHGTRTWALRCVRALADAGIGEIYHLGDFGIWPGPRGRNYLLDLDAALGSHAMTLFVTPGNHEDYDQIEELPALDLGHEIGEVQWITDHIAILPRGHRWERNGWSFASLGGAPSV